jgi:hypothetical protein
VAKGEEDRASRGDGEPRPPWSCCFFNVLVVPENEETEDMKERKSRGKV